MPTGKAKTDRARPDPCGIGKGGPFWLRRCTQERRHLPGKDKNICIPMQSRLCLSLFFLLARHGVTANIDQITVFFCVFFVLSSYLC